MRIAQIVCVFEPYRSGIGNIAKQYAEIVHQAGYESFVITPRYKNRKQYSSNSFEMVYLRPLLEYGNGSFIPQLVSKLRDFDIVHLHYPFFGGSEAVWLAKIIKKIKIKLYC